MAPHRYHQKPKRRSNTKTMNEMIEDIMELENQSHSGKPRGQKSAAKPSPMGDSNNYRILDASTGQLLSPKKSSSYRLPRSRGGSDNRKKKDDHNVIERKRRNNINNLIKELRSLVPPAINETSKGGTLKATVDYLRGLKSDAESLRVYANSHKQCDQNNRKLQERIKELEQALNQKQANVRHPVEHDQALPGSPPTIPHKRDSMELTFRPPINAFTNAFKMELEQQYESQVFPAYEYLEAPSIPQDLQPVEFSDEDFAEILKGVAPSEMAHPVMHDPLVSYFDMDGLEAQNGLVHFM
ncbi:hypothetical protein RvY_08189 [Ramazzottius varieornatus]|uniref:BHLH domain-containing protein n=1 Tax=Ramazzottius varieornatus TaxID=947166 RepID=A0A1D1V524_RAMVA|nr:hypothetical protein RvY_08189 [Ramazzottius varieornatus]